MRNLLDVLAFRYWLISLIVLFFKMWANGLIQGIYRARSDTFDWPEDTRTFGRGSGSTARLPEGFDRATRCWRNDLENIPIYLFLGLGFVLSGGLPFWAALYFTTFTVARIAHTIFYMAGLQPWRTIAYTIGLLVCVALAVHLIVLLVTVQPV
jgi:uncharacterized MAPEG superfamily protein